MRLSELLPGLEVLEKRLMAVPLQPFQAALDLRDATTGLVVQCPEDGAALEIVDMHLVGDLVDTRQEDLTKTSNHPGISRLHHPGHPLNTVFGQPGK